jgi:hypothetical protein
MPIKKHSPMTYAEDQRLILDFARATQAAQHLRERIVDLHSNSQVRGAIIMEDAGTGVVVPQHFEQGRFDLGIYRADIHRNDTRPDPGGNTQ